MPSSIGTEVEPAVGKESENRPDSVAATATSKTQGTTTTVSGGALVTENLLQLAEAIRTIVPKGNWQSLGSEKEIALENATTVQKRPPIKVQFEVKRNVLLKHHSALMGFVTKEASEDSRDLRGSHNPLYEVMRQEVDVGVQAVRPRTDTHSQTYFARTATMGVQAEPTIVDACIHHLNLPKKEAPEMTAFLKKVLPRTLHCLTQNEEVPIYTDDYVFKEDDALVGAHDDLALVEKGNYTHAVTKDRQVTSISWRSARRKDDYVCITSIAKQSLEERIDANRLCEGSLSLVWELTDPMHPRYILEAPAEVQALHFCPSQSHIVAGASMSGQVFLWDLSKAQSVPGFVAGGEQGANAAGEGVKNTVVTGEFKEAGDVVPMSEHVAGITLESDGDVMVPRLQPFQVSRVEVSHRRAVHDLQWLPPQRRVRLRRPPVGRGGQPPVRDHQ
ncbi:hypothetical protein STCU_10377 [Strigomonas culicis]|uniref:Guanine nucleotide-binding protein subunit beta-like protein n=1 Tax=Strigomonas culicis TaxID=28005 RepID=S9TN81_9TRYP|nr:hypothetical protein STCU_10377 [Strigomonas culicis]|eukprot:EPY17838.1 hypothetical protein STCU_10377 [Strigomonas culicis]